jgi:hypothetical protein
MTTDGRVPCLRHRLRVWLGCAAAAMSGGAVAHAGHSGLALSIADTAALHPEVHASIAVVASLPEACEGQPLLLTPHVEGEAIELVRGRLLRADAKLEAPGRLRFSVPVVARRAGTAIFRIVLMTYACAPTCEQVTAQAEQILRVQ